MVAPSTARLPIPMSTSLDEWLAAQSHSAAHSGAMIVHVMHGLSNRIRAYASARALAEATGRTSIALVWVPDIHCGARFDDLFDPDSDLTVFHEFDDTRLLERGDVAIHVVESNGNARRVAPGGTLGSWENYTSASAPSLMPQRHLYVRASRALMPSHLGLGAENLTALLLHGNGVAAGGAASAACDVRCRLGIRARAVLQRLRPVAAVRERLEHLTRELEAQGRIGSGGLANSLLGVHVRMLANLSADVPAIEATTDRSIDVSAMLNVPRWRMRCNWRSFVQPIRESIAQMTRPLVAFVAADTPEAAPALCKALEGTTAEGSATGDEGGVRNRGITCAATPAHVLAPCYGPERRGVACQRLALVELYMLARSTRLVVSDMSSFSDLARALGQLNGKHWRSGCATGRAGGARKVGLQASL